MNRTLTWKTYLKVCETIFLERSTEWLIKTSRNVNLLRFSRTSKIILLFKVRCFPRLQKIMRDFANFKTSKNPLVWCLSSQKENRIMRNWYCANICCEGILIVNLNDVMTPENALTFKRYIIVRWPSRSCAPIKQN